VPSHLRPLADGLVSMHRPHSGVAWLRRSAIARETLQDLARDRMPCSHAALDALGTDRAAEYLRSLLVRYGALPPRDRRLADFHRWAAAKLDTIGDAGHRQLLERFLRWRLLRHLRSGGTTATPLGHGPYQRAKQRLTVAIAFLAWPADRGRHLGECTQHDLDAWFGTGPTTRRHVITFLSWARQQRIIRDVEIPAISTAGAEACPPGSDARLAAIRRLLLDETLAPGDRITGCLVVLYGQQASTIAALRTTDTSCQRRDPSQARRGLARRARARGHLAPASPGQPHQHDRSSQPGLAMAVSRAARRRTPQLPPARPRSPSARHPCPGGPAGRIARTRPAGTTRRPRRRAGRLTGHSDAPRVPRRRRLVRLRRSKTCSHPGRQDVVVGHRDGVSPSAWNGHAISSVRSGWRLLGLPCWGRAYPGIIYSRQGMPSGSVDASDSGRADARRR
jgi:hypothetical protein